MRKYEDTMTDEEWLDSLARESEEEKQNRCRPTKQFEREYNQIWKDIEKQYGY